jgi:low temperature requirement protein LtrA
MLARPVDEQHRASSPLELLFDLTFVVAIAQVAAALAHSAEEGHLGDAVGPYLMTFFAIWWAWMNFTWFASGYDTDDVPYRLFTMVQMAGVLVLAAGVPSAFDGSDYATITYGYLLMRVGLVGHWLRAAVEDPAHRGTAVRYAIGIALVQAGWLLRLWIPGGQTATTFVVLALLDMAVPLWAARAGHSVWHPHHIAERYGLFTIIVLGESVLAATVGVQDALAALGEEGVNADLVVVAASALVIVFSLWWLYYLEPAGTGLAERRSLSYYWGYGHYAIFAALAALGAGLEVAVLSTAHPVEAPDVAVAALVAIPVAVFLLLLWAVHAPLVHTLGIRPVVILPAAVVVALAPLATGAIGIVGVVVVVAVVPAAAVALTLVRASRTRVAA